MNIFVLDEDPILCAQYTVDKHVVKMVTETAQILSSAYYFTDWTGPIPCDLAHPNHGCCKWARESIQNWQWLAYLGVCLYQEYMFRYGTKSHEGGNKVVWCYEHPPRLPDIGMTSHVLMMPDQYKFGTAVDSYRRYYIHEKSVLFKWTNRGEPDWIHKNY